MKNGSHAEIEKLALFNVIMVVQPSNFLYYLFNALTHPVKTSGLPSKKLI